jgi:outer membrane protein OmpA-like peptidoglycan-associated protein
MNSPSLVRILALLCPALSLMLFEPRVVASACAAEELSAETIAKALKGRKTRSGPGDGVAGKEIEELKRIRKTRAWNLHDRTQLAEVTRDLPQVDVEVYFAFDSAEILPQALPTLDKLGTALSQAEFKGIAFVLAGHADAKGTAEYNRGLSERRAEAVKRFLKEKFNLSAADFMTVGYGFEQLKDPDHPLSEVNRRVQVVNFSN